MFVRIYDLFLYSQQQKMARFKSLESPYRLFVGLLHARSINSNYVLRCCFLVHSAVHMVWWAHLFTNSKRLEHYKIGDFNYVLYRCL